MKAIRVCCGALQIGILLGWSSPAVSMLEHPDQYGSPVGGASFTEINWIVSIVPLGAVCSCLIAGWIADKIGRKTVIVITAIPSLICWILSYAIPSVAVLLATRFILGLGMGIVCTTVPIYIGEIAETSIRGKLGTQFQVFLFFGEILMFGMALFKNYNILAVPGIVCSLTLQLGSFFIPETPFYLIAADNSDRAAEVLRKLREPGSSGDVSDELREMKETVNRQKLRPPLSEVLRSKSNRKSIVIGIVMMVFQQLSGVNCIILYSQSIFEKQLREFSPVWITIVVGVISLITTVACGRAVDVAGRKTLLIVSGCGMAISFWILGTNIILMTDMMKIGSPWTSVTMILCFMMAFCVGYGSVPWVLTGEIFSFEVKRLANSVAVAVNFICVFVVSYGFRLSLRLIGEAGTFYVFGTFSIIGVIIVAYYVPETKNRSFAEIQAALET